MSHNPSLIQEKVNRPFSPSEAMEALNVQASKRVFSSVQDERPANVESAEDALKKNENQSELHFNEETLLFRLEALQYPFLHDFDFTDFHAMQKLIVWLEDAHIAMYPNEKRQGLRSKEFMPALKEYISLFPFEIPEPNGENLMHVVAHLTALALRLYYNDHRDVLEEPVDPWMGLAIPVINGISEEPSVEDQVCNLLKALDLKPPVPEIYQKLAVVADTVEGCLNRRCNPGGEKEALSKVDLGWKATTDEAVDRAIRVASILLLRKQATIQDRINAGIREMQKFTADPKTDAKRGRVGR